MTDINGNCAFAGVTWDPTTLLVKTENQWTFVASYKRLEKSEALATAYYIDLKAAMAMVENFVSYKAYALSDTVANATTVDLTSGDDPSDDGDDYSGDAYDYSDDSGDATDYSDDSGDADAKSVAEVIDEALTKAFNYMKGLVWELKNTTCT